MSNEYENLGDKIPDFGSVLVKRVTDRTSGNNDSTVLPPAGCYDPYKLMLQKKKNETGEIDPKTIQVWPEIAVKQLEDYCKKMGIYGFNSGKLHPLIALSQLKKQFGEDYTGVPLNERVPAGYEPLGTPSYGPNNTYSEVMRKQILHG